MATNGRVTGQDQSYMGWVEALHIDEHQPSGGNGYAVLDLLHPDELARIRQGQTFANLVERRLDDGLKTLPLILPFDQMKPKWRTAIERVDQKPGTRLTVRFGATAIDGLGTATLALSGAPDGDAQPEPIYISHIGLATKRDARQVDRALNTSAYRIRVGRHPPTPGAPATPRDHAQFLRHILENRVQHEPRVFVAVYDVGQGSASAIVNEFEHPCFFFDIGKPIAVFPHTLPTHAPDFFKCDDLPSSAPVVLSHWDFDHWAGVLEKSHVRKDKKGNRHATITVIPHGLERFWIAPNQEHLELGPTHRELIRQLLQTTNPVTGKCALQYWPAKLHYLQFSHGVIVKAHDASATSRTEQINNSGLAMLITHSLEHRPASKSGLLLQGDARLESLALDWDGVELVGIVVSHHGGKLDGVPQASTVSSAKSAAANLRNRRPLFNAVCSVGRAKMEKGVLKKPYGHPDDDTIDKHERAGWTVRFTYTETTPPACHKQLGNVVLSLDQRYPRCGCACACAGNLSLNPL